MILRLLVAAVGLSVLLPALFLGGVLAIEIIVPIAMVICLDEYARMAFPDDRWPALAWLAVATFAPYAAAMHGTQGTFTPVVGLVVMATFIFVTLRPGPPHGDADLDGAADRVGRYLMGASWVGLLAYLLMLRRLPDGVAWVMLVLAIAWLSDTGGYFAGKYFGRRKLYERVSPKKTWAGFFGGIVLCTVGVLVVRQVALTEHLTVFDGVLLGIIAGTTGVLGDLGESLLKRAFKVKDTGAIMPGHGGLLDRIDSVLFAGASVFAYVSLIKGM